MMSSEETTQLATYIEGGGSGYRPSERGGATILTHSRQRASLGCGWTGIRKSVARLPSPRSLWLSSGHLMLGCHDTRIPQPP